MKLKKTTELNPHIGKLKPFKIPDGLSIVIDTREQLPLFIKELPRKDGKVVKGGYTGKLNIMGEYEGELNVFIDTLKYGDYTIKGFEDKFAIERKQMSDFYLYIGKERQSKTTGKMEAFKKIIQAKGFVALVINADEEEVLSGFMMSTLSPEVARQFLHVWRVRFGLHVYTSKYKKSIERFVLDSMIRFYKEMRKV